MADSLGRIRVESPLSPFVIVNGVRLQLDPSGAVFWPERRLLAVADLHFEKGSSYARNGRFLPPYDTAATLARSVVIVRVPSCCALAISARLRI